ALLGAPATADRFRRAARAELADARPLRDNAYKVALAENLVTAVLGDLAVPRNAATRTQEDSP
ncbi:xanthine dehydrogenase family protein subunit M, partial [Embleya sp. NPDC005575]